MSVYVAEIIRRANSILIDSNIRWPGLELQDWINDAYREIVKRRPDAYTKNVQFTCDVGSRQSLAAAYTDATRLLKVDRASADDSAGRTIKPIDRRSLDITVPDWVSEEGSLNPEFYIFQLHEPLVFWLYPPALSTTEVDLTYAAVPPKHSYTESQLDPDTGVTASLYLDDLYADDILNFVVYRAFNKDSGEQGNHARAEAHFAAFEKSLALKTEIDVATKPT